MTANGIVYLLAVGEFGISYVTVYKPPALVDKRLAIEKQIKEKVNWHCELNER